MPNAFKKDGLHYGPSHKAIFGNTVPTTERPRSPTVTLICLWLQNHPKHYHLAEPREKVVEFFHLSSRERVWCHVTVAYANFTRNNSTPLTTTKFVPTSFLSSFAISALLFDVITLPNVIHPRSRSYDGINSYFLSSISRFLQDVKRICLLSSWNAYVRLPSVFLLCCKHRGHTVRKMVADVGVFSRQ